MSEYITYSYKLRSAGPVPIAPGVFIQQTFGVDRSKITTYVAEECIKTTTCDMAGAGGNLISANWQRLPYLTKDCKNVFNGTEVTRPDFIDALGILT
jgi:hypothetical protein